MATHAKQDGRFSLGHSTRRVLLTALFALATGTATGGCSPSSGGSSNADSGGSGDAGAGGPLGFGFFPSNVACGLAQAPLAAAAADAGVDLSALGDVDIKGAPFDSLYSSKDTIGSIVSVPVLYTTVTQSDGSTVGVYIARSWTIEAGATLTLAGKYPLVLVALTSITIGAGGLIDATSTPPGGNVAPSAEPGPGGGPGGGPGESTTGAGFGAGGGSFCGTGGVGTSSTQVTPAYGQPSLVPLLAGSSGGNSSYAGGTGGGALQLVAGTSITVDGAINVGGLAGYRASGGGSGGSLLLEAPMVSVTGTLAANGGGGSNVFGSNPAQNGQPSATPATGSVAGNGDATGGEGSAGAALNGGPAGALVSKGGGFGGGGGGAGYIRINTSGTAATPGGTVSPAPSTTCFSAGTLAQEGVCH